MVPLLLAAALAAQAPVTGPAPRSLSFGAYTKKAAPVADLDLSEVAVEEAGRRCNVVALTRDTRPLEVAVVVDSSAAAASYYRSDLVAAITGFWRSLPEGAKVAVFTSGPPSRVVDFTGDLAAAEPVLQKVACAGKNYAFEAIADAARALAARPPSRRALVYLGSALIEGTQTRTTDATRALGEAQAPPTVVLLTAMAGGAPLGGPTDGISTGWDVEGFFAKVAAAYGGSFAAVLSPQAASKHLALSAAELSAAYLLRYESTGESAGPVTVTVKRKDVKLRVGRPQRVAPVLIGEMLAGVRR